MKTQLQTLAMAGLAGLLAFGNSSHAAHISVNIGGPPVVVENNHWAPLHTYHHRIAYRYYPSYGVYFNPDEDLYYYLVDGGWVVSEVLPGYIRDDLGEYQWIDLDGYDPRVYNDVIVRRYRPVHVIHEREIIHDRPIIHERHDIERRPVVVHDRTIVHDRPVVVHDKTVVHDRPRVNETHAVTIKNNDRHDIDVRHDNDQRPNGADHPRQDVTHGGAHDIHTDTHAAPTGKGDVHRPAGHGDTVHGDANHDGVADGQKGDAGRGNH